jgi:hypothetical protein
VNGTIDRDGGFFDEMLTQGGVEFVHRLDDAAQVFGLDVNSRTPPRRLNPEVKTTRAVIVLASPAIVMAGRRPVGLSPQRIG